jgi:transcriptional regulator with GAF, ATPase, and Fis domain
MFNVIHLDFLCPEDQLSIVTDEKKQLAKKLDLLNEVILGLCFYSTPENCLAEYLKKIMSLENIDVACLFSVDRKAKRLNLESCSSTNIAVKKITGTLSTEAGYRLASRGLPVFSKMKKFQHLIGLTQEKSIQFKAIAFIPIIIKTKIIAVLVVGSRHSDSWSFESKELMEMVARPAGFIMNQFSDQGLQLELNFSN